LRSIFSNLQSSRHALQIQRLAKPLGLDQFNHLQLVGRQALALGLLARTVDAPEDTVPKGKVSLSTQCE
jgi:hypothetical protein